MPVTPVSAENDITNGPTSHVLLALFLPDLWDCAALMNHYAGRWAGRHSLTSNVKFNKQRIVLDGHDQGPLLLHLPIGDFYRSLKSNRKPCYAASKVQANKVPLACVDNDHELMLCGDPVSVPFGWNCTNEAHNLFIGMSDDDQLKGTLGIVASVITDVVAFAVACAAGGPVATAPAELLADFFGVDPVKMVVAGHLGLLNSVITSAVSDWKEPITYKLETGNGFRAMTHEVSYNPSSGAWEHKGSQSAAGFGKSEYGGQITKPRTPVPSTSSTWGEPL